ncbi:peptidase inhibitor family I36 protein [Spirillospora sp. CA-142024]|uniref:peptidase inhibitor family I36 protein n=1 Tax=Spirillospora sp. CA-142024 TaxID=3240036 RepID=UPI003D8CE0A9
MNRIRTGLLAGAVVAGAITAVAPSAAMAATTRSTDGVCPKGDVCVWSGKNATGVRCNWTGNDPDWQGGAVQCKPHGFKVYSIWNNGYTSDPYNKVRFYKYANYGTELYDPMPVTSQPVNAAGIPIRSHKWSK